MNLDWVQVHDSTRITAYAYIPDKKTILVRLTSGPEWAYLRCSEADWRAFQRAASKGKYIAEYLNHKPNHEW